MKKLIKILLSFLCLCPLLLLTACSASTYYVINVSSSDDYIGTFSNNRNNNPRQLEGTSITLTAIEKSPSNPFICWIKDNKTVISTNSKLQMKYSGQTAGNYTAVFEETPSGMMYTALDNLRINNSNYYGTNFALYYSNTISGNDMYVELERGSIGSDGTFNSSHTSVLYLGSVGTINSFQYKFKIEFTASDGNMQFFETTAVLSNSTFNNTNTASVTITDSSSSDITLNFEKLSKNMYTV